MSTINYISEQTFHTPLINFNGENGNFELKGKSIPENSALFYKPFFEWLDKYASKPAPITVLNIQLDYFSTSSSKCIYDMFKKLEKLSDSKKSEVFVNWHYNENDEDMEEVGVDFKSLFKIPFELVSFKK